MAEIALAIIPLGIQACSGILQFSRTLKDQNEDLACVVRQAESLEAAFKCLQATLQQSALNPATSPSATVAATCLQKCEAELKKIHFIVTDIVGCDLSQAGTRERCREGIRRLSYPLRKSQLDKIKDSLYMLCQPLQLALQSMNFDATYLSSGALRSTALSIRQASDDISSLKTYIGALVQPLSEVQLELPLLQSSVHAIVPQISTVVDNMQSQFQTNQLATQQELLQEIASLRTLVLNGQDSRTTTLRLAAKPSSLSHALAQADSLLHEASGDEISPANSYHRYNFRRQICPCRPSRTSDRRWFAWGPLQICDERTSDLQHDAGCRFFSVNEAYKRKSTVTFTGISRLLNKAIELSFYTKTGAGGVSIGPSIACYAVIDYKTAPAFQVVEYLRECFDYLSSLSKNDKMDVIRLFETALQKLQILFTSGRASPTDVDLHHNTILHKLAEAIEAWARFWNDSCLQPDNADLPKRVIDSMTAAGVPASMSNSEGQTALLVAAESMEFPLSFYEGLYYEGADCRSYRGRRDQLFPRPIFKPTLARFQYFSEHLKISDVFYGPLSNAILRNAREEALHLIQRYPHYLHEKNLYGQTPLHIAVYKPDLLRLLVSKYDPALLITTDNRGETPLSYAIRLSENICDNRADLSGSNCPCTSAVRALLGGEYPLIPLHEYCVMSDSLYGSSKGSRHCKMQLATQLLQRRQALKNLALRSLTRLEIDTYQLGQPKVLDVYAIQVDRLLRQRGYLQFGRLSTYLDHDLDANESRFYCRSVYRDLDCPDEAEIYRTLGFSEFDIPREREEAWITPHIVGFRKLGVMSLSYAKWFTENNGPLQFWQDRNPKLWEFEWFFSDELGKSSFLALITNRSESYNEEESWLLAMESSDSCRCYCSPEGCTPFTVRIKWLGCATSFKHPPKVWAKMYKFYVGNYGRGLSSCQHLIVIRQATFANLGMRHTCLHRPWQGSKVLDLEIEEINELQAEDAEPAKVLEELMVEFEDIVIGNSAYEAGVNELDLDKILDFWSSTWPARVEQALEDMNDGLDDYKNAAERIGVRWASSKEEYDESNFLNLSNNEVIDHFIQKVEEV